MLPAARHFLDRILPELIAAKTVPEDIGTPLAPPSGKLEMLEEAAVTLGKLLYELGHGEPSLECYRFALSLAPGLVIAHWNLSLALLWRGEFAEGWKEYEWRWFWDRFPEPRRALPVPTWRGEPLEGKTIGVFTEQGYGDAVQFSSLLPQLLKRTDSVVLETTAPLVRLFANSFTGVTVTERGNNPHQFNTPKPLDYVVPLMSLPDLMGLKEQDLTVARD